jgi:beta-glucosidase-like glycosyl hydrolase
LPASYGAGEAAVLALEAGADLVLMPADAGEAIEAIAAAVTAGRLSQAQLEPSAMRRQEALAGLPPGPTRQTPSPLHRRCRARHGAARSC